MTNKNKAFQATEFIKRTNQQREVQYFFGDMAICLDDGTVIITKQQAMDFWGLVDGYEYTQGVKWEDKDNNINQEKCPATNQYCKHYSNESTQDYGIINYCSHVDNKFKMAAGNCTRDLCPILVKNN